jgi:hypothetical protein
VCAPDGRGKGGPRARRAARIGPAAHLVAKPVELNGVKA